MRIKEITSKIKRFFNKYYKATWFVLIGLIGIIQVQLQIANQSKQIRIQREQSNKQLRDTRFSSGVELLGNLNESARIGGAYNLYFLANEYPSEYLNPVCEILCAHIRTITTEKEYHEKYVKQPSNETQTILRLLFIKNKQDNIIFNECYKNLEGVFFYGINFSLTTLNNVNLQYAKLNDVIFRNDTISNVDFSNATISNIDFAHAILNNVDFWDDATLSNVDFALAQLNNVSFWNASLNNVRFLRVKLEDVNFSNAKLKDVDFTNAISNKGNIDFRGATKERVYLNATSGIIPKNTVIE